MVITLFLGMIVNTFFPQFLAVGGMTEALWGPRAGSTFLAMCIFAVGANMRLKTLVEAMKRGTVLLLAKFVAGAGVGILIGKYFGEAGVFGITALAFIPAVTSSNGGLYMSLASEYGDNTDIGAQAIIGFNGGPFLTMLAFSMSGMADIPFSSLLGSLLPLLIGMVLGNLDHDIATFLKPLGAICIPFFAFPLGAAINLLDVFQSGFSGILLGFICFFWSGFVCVLADKFINRRPGFAGVAIANTAANCVATPAFVAAADPSFAPYVKSATVQCAAACVVTSILVPIFTALAVKKWGTSKEFDERKAAKEAEKK